MEENTLVVSRKDVEKAYGPGCFPEYDEFALCVNPEDGVNKFFLMGKEKEHGIWVIIHQVYSKRHLSSMAGG